MSKLMYRLSRNEMYIQKTRGNIKIKFKRMTKCSSKYLGGPYIRAVCFGTNLKRALKIYRM